MAELLSVLVSRAALVQALRLISSAGSPSKAGRAILRAQGKTVTLERAGHSQEMPAQGDAEFEAQFDLDFGKFASKLPSNDQLEVGFDGTHISFGRYRHPATPAATESPLTAIAEKEKQRRIARAVQVLEPYFVKASDLTALCGSESHFAEGEQALTDRIAKA